MTHICVTQPQWVNHRRHHDCIRTNIKRYLRFLHHRDTEWVQILATLSLGTHLNCLSYILNDMTADYLATQGARALTAWLPHSSRANSGFSTIGVTQLRLDQCDKNYIDDKFQCILFNGNVIFNESLFRLATCGDMPSELLFNIDTSNNNYGMKSLILS